MSTLVIVGLRQRKPHFSSQALAEMVAEQLRLARQSALAQQQPVALCFPSQNGQSPVCQSLYWATGRSMAHVSKVVDYSTTYPQQVLFQGLWGASATTFPLRPGGSPESFQAAPWLANPNMGSYQLPLDYCLIFTSDGGVTSNGLPLQNGAYHIVVATGVKSTPCAQPVPTSPKMTSALSYFQASAWGAPHCIEILPTGNVRVLSSPEGPSDTPQAVVGVASPPTVVPLPGLQPKSTNVVLLPKPTTTIPGVDVTMVAGQRVSLQVSASDSSGRDVFLQWECQRNAANISASNGTFSKSGLQSMNWEPGTQAWTSQWDWICPLDAGVNDKFVFSCQFGDGTGLVAPGPPPINVLAIRPTQIFYLCGTGPCQLIQTNSDGSCPRLKMTVPTSHLTLNQHCTQLLDLDYNLTYSVSTGDQVGKVPNIGWYGVLTPSDNWLIEIAPDLAGNLRDIVVHRLDGSANQVLVPGLGPLYKSRYWKAGMEADYDVGGSPEGNDMFFFSPDQRHLAYSSGDGIHVVDLVESASTLTASGDRIIANTPGTAWGNRMVNWTPDSKELFLSVNSLHGGQFCRVDATTLAVTPLPQLDAFSQILAKGCSNPSSSSPGSATLAKLASAGDRFYMINQSGKICSADVNTGTIETLGDAPVGVQSFELREP